MKTSHHSVSHSFRKAFATAVLGFVTLIAGEAHAQVGLISCQTQSNNIPFQHSSRDTRFSRDEAIRSCQQNVSTDNRECELNISCNDGSRYPDMVSCDTFSAGRNFVRSVRDQSYARQLVISACQRDTSTNNRECEVNTLCRVDGSGNPVPNIQLQQMVGSWKASNCPNCFLQVQLFGNQLYGDMIPWDVNRSYSGGPQLLTFLSGNVILYRNDQYRVQQAPVGPGRPPVLELIRLTRNNPNVESATLFGNGNPPPLCPVGTVWDPRQNRCVQVGPPPPPLCPPGTVWDARQNRCVIIGPPPPPQCPPGTVWDRVLNRCISIITPPPPLCPPGTIWDARTNRCIVVGPPPPPPRQWTCSIHHFRVTSFDRNSAMDQVLNQCALASGGWVCRASDVRCFQ